MNEIIPPKIFLPGPIEVSPEIRQAMSCPAIGHRSSEFSSLYREIAMMMQKFFKTEMKLFIGTCSATGIMEASIRNAVDRRCLCAVNGAFAERWHRIALSCGKDADRIDFDWGKPVKPEKLYTALKFSHYDAVTVVHNESSTGVCSPVGPIAEMLTEFPDTLLLVDAVSSAGGMDINLKGIDVLITASQKAFALPPGITPFFVSEKILTRSGQMENKGFYFDFMQFDKHYRNFEPPFTPSVPHYYALKKQLEGMIKEGPKKRFSRHRKMADMIRKWAEKNFGMFSEEGFHSDTISCIRSLHSLDVKEFISALVKRGYIIGNGYGRLKDVTFRIGHMGDWTPPDIKELIEAMDETLEEMGK